MTNLVKHRGYYGLITYSPEDNLYVARTAGTGQTYISCHGETVEDAAREFNDSINFYLETCLAEGWKPCITDPDVARRMDLQFANERNAGVQHIPSGRLEMVSAH